MGVGDRIQKGESMKKEITAGDRVRVLDCPNRAGQIGIAGHAYGPLRSVGFASVLISEKNARVDLDRKSVV